MEQESATNLVRASASPRWPGTARYEVVGVLGEGGMGVVYEAFDRERGQTVAIKTLPRFDAGALYLFKQEFRTLVDIRHTNLVRLCELVVPDEGQAFFSMELVRGVDFKTYVQRAPMPTAQAVTPSARPPRRDTMRPRRAAAAQQSRPSRTPADINRLRSALRQLVAGVHALHSGRKVHRDIKPSNVLVGGDGRVVLLDFGVASEVPRMVGRSLHNEYDVVGTAAYMAPEQAAGEAPTPASDWYSVGVVLFEALTGRPPFTGSAFDVITMKTMMDPLAPSTYAEGVPADLDDLCLALLRHDPVERPSGTEVLRRLGMSQSTPPLTTQPGTAPEAGLVGRDALLLALREALEVVRGGRTVAVNVSGGAGMGKSTAAHAFLDELARAGDALILRGRAYERESVPYKAVDAAIDALSRHLMRLAQSDSLPALPPDTWALARLFPVLERVPMPLPDAAAVGDPQAVRRRALHALPLLLSAVGQGRTIVLFVDDAQWGDVDSAALLLDVVRSPDAPPLLVLMTHRAGALTTSPFLAELHDRWPDSVLVTNVDVGPLSFDDAQTLALALLGASDDVAKRVARAVARESRGSPFLVEELVRANRTLPLDESLTLTALTLDQMVSERMERLTESAQAVLKVTAVGGRPLPVSVVAEAAGLRAIEDEVALGVARRFLRVWLRDGRDVVEITHDRIRETIVAQLPEATLREHHGRLAKVLQETANTDAEAIATHWLYAGDRERAAEYAESAAEQVASKLAFDQAARLVELAIANTPARRPAVRRLRRRLGELLKNGGRGVESARVFLSLVDEAPAAERVEYQRLAAEQLLVAGCIDEGAELLHRVLAAAGMKAPRSRFAAVFWLIVYRAWLWLMGLRVRERRPDEVPAEARARIEALYTATTGFSIVDVVLSACMQARHLVEALRYGDRFQLLRAVSHEAGHLAATGKAESARELRLVEISRELAAHEGTVVADGYHAATRGMGLFQRGRFREAAELLDRGQKAIPSDIAGMAVFRIFFVSARFMLGELKETRKRVARLRADAEARGDRYTTVSLRTSLSIHTALAVDDVADAQRAPRDALAQWTQRGFHVQHWQAMVFGPDADLYAGDGVAAYERFARGLSPLRRSLLLHAGPIRAWTYYFRARYAVGSIEGAPQLRARRVAEALRMASLLSREPNEWTSGLVAIARACAHNAAGDRDAALTALRIAAERLVATDVLLYLQPVRYRLGQLLGGDEGEALRRDARDAMIAQGIRNPDRWAAIHMPGRWETAR